MVNPKELNWARADTIKCNFAQIIRRHLDEFIRAGTAVKVSVKLEEFGALGNHVVICGGNSRVLAVVMLHETSEHGGEIKVYRAVIKPSNRVYYTNATDGEHFISWLKAIADAVIKTSQN